MKIWIFRGIACALPVLFFVLLEIILRVSGFGHNYTLFVQNPAAPQYLLPRPDVVKRYFPPGADVPSVTIETNFFKKRKPENGVRIFVQGGSTAAGFPYGYGASIAGMLDYRLKQSFPDRPVEVVNTALSAVNSFTLLDFSDEIIEQQPDAILIYAGHNEYLGVLGVGSSYSIADTHGSTLLFLKLKDLKIFQFLQYIYWSLVKSAAKPDDSDSRTMMARIAKHKNIPRDSVIFERGLNQFEQNIRLLVEKYQRAGIPVFISTIASNLADQKPFSAPDLVELQKERGYSDTQLALLRGVIDGSLADVLPRDQAFIEKEAEETLNADLFYALGKVFQGRGDYALAQQLFVKARDHDLLRFRAPTEMNSIIRTLADEYDLNFVDAYKALEKEADNGIIGAKLMLEHLHPTTDGYFVIADTFYNALAESKLWGDFPRRVERDAAYKEMPIFPAEEYWGKAKIADLVADYPFTQTREKAKLPPQKNWSDRLGYQAYKNKIGWVDIALSSLKNYEGNTLKYALGSKLLADAIPNNPDYSYKAGVNLIRAGRAYEAPRYLLRAIELKPRIVNYQLALIHSYVLQKRPKQVQYWVRSVLKLDPGNNMALEVAKKFNIQ